MFYAETDLTVRGSRTSLCIIKVIASHRIIIVERGPICLTTLFTSDALYVLFITSAVKITLFRMLAKGGCCSIPDKSWAQYGIKKIGNL